MSWRVYLNDKYKGTCKDDVLIAEGTLTECVEFLRDVGTTEPYRLESWRIPETAARRVYTAEDAALVALVREHAVSIPHAVAQKASELARVLRRGRVMTAPDKSRVVYSPWRDIVDGRLAEVVRAIEAQDSRWQFDGCSQHTNPGMGVVRCVWRE